jgi:hypothetical protein
MKTENMWALNALLGGTILMYGAYSCVGAPAEPPLKPPVIAPVETSAIPNDDAKVNTYAETQADSAEKSRKKSMQQIFPVRETTFDGPNGCIEQHGGFKITNYQMKGSPFRLRLGLAFKANLGNEFLARRFINYISTISKCSAYSESELERIILPALPFLRTTSEMGTLIAAAGDLNVMQAGDAENFAKIVRTLLEIATGN